MIRFYDGTALPPTTKEMEGKIILRKGIFRFRTFGKPGRVTKTSNRRVYYTPITFNEELNRESVESYIDISSVGAVCDTEAEASSLIEACKQAIHIHAKYENECKREIDGLYNKLAEQKEGAAIE